jgi:hypothetical protein
VGWVLQNHKTLQSNEIQLSSGRLIWDISGGGRAESSIVRPSYLLDTAFPFLLIAPQNIFGDVRVSIYRNTEWEIKNRYSEQS